MNMRRIIKTVNILILIYLNNANTEYFKHGTRTLNDIRQQAFYLDCIQVNLSNMDEFVFNFVFNMRIPMIISNDLNNFEIQASPTCLNLIVQLDSTENLQAILEYSVRNRGVIFILFNQKVDWDTIIMYSLYYWEKYQIYNVFYITPEQARFYHPFLLRNDKYGALVDIKHHIIKDLFKNLYGYPMRVFIFNSVFSEVQLKKNATVVSIKGVDANVAYLLEKTLNFTLQLQLPDEAYFGARLENGSYDGALGRMIRHETDITMTGFFVKDYLTRNISFSASIYMDKLCCYVMKSKRVPQSILPLYAVKDKVWIVYISMGLVASFTWILIRHANLYIWKCDYEKRYTFSALHFHYLEVLIATWVLWVRMVLIRFPPYNAERIFAISLCLASVIIGSILESSLATVYIHHPYYKDINTLEELYQKNFTIFIKHKAISDDLFKGQNSSLYNNLDERIKLVGEPEDHLKYMVSKHARFAAVTRQYALFTLDIYHYITKKIHIIAECPKTYHISYLFTKNSPYYETFNAALLQFLAAGLINQWIRITKHKAQCQLYNFKDATAEGFYQWKSFQINDLQLAFYVLIFGNFSAILLFLIEFIYAHKKKTFIKYKNNV